MIYGCVLLFILVRLPQLRDPHSHHIHTKTKFQALPCDSMGASFVMCGPVRAVYRKRLDRGARRSCGCVCVCVSVCARTHPPGVCVVRCYWLVLGAHELRDTKIDFMRCCVVVPHREVALRIRLYVMSTESIWSVERGTR